MPRSGIKQRGDRQGYPEGRSQTPEAEDGDNQGTDDPIPHSVGAPHNRVGSSTTTSGPQDALPNVPSASGECGQTIGGQLGLQCVIGDPEDETSTGHLSYLKFDALRC